MIRRSRASALLVLAVLGAALPLLGTSPVQAATSTVSSIATGDAYVSSAKPKDKYGGAKHLRVSGTPTQRAYLRFTVSGVTGTVTKATLSFRVMKAAAVPLEVRRTDGSWDERSVTWLTAPAPGEVVGTAPSVPADRLDIDVTSAVTGNGQVDLVVLVPNTSAASKAVAELSSREGGKPQPILTVTTSDAPDTTPPAAPTGLTAAPGDSAATLGWNASTDSDLAGYRVYRRLATGDWPTTPLATVSTSAYTDQSVVNGTTYDYRVTAVDAAGNDSQPSAEVTVTPQATSTPDTTPPAAPTGLAVTAGDTLAALTWQANTEPDLASYRVYRRVTGGSWDDTPITARTSTSFTDTTVTNGTSYDYRLTAVDASGNESTPSSTVTARPTSSTSPCATSSDYSSAVLDTAGLSAYWRLGDTTGSTACDARGTSPGTYNGGVALGSPGAITGDSNTAVTLDGSTGYVRIASNAALNPSASMTFEAWVSPTTTGSRQTLIRKEKQYLLRITGGTLVGRIWTGSGYTEISSGAVLTTGYQHLAMTYDGATIRLFRNGNQIASKALTGSIVTGGNAVFLGMSPDPSENYDFLTGRLDEVALYSTALSSATLAGHYRLGTTGAPSPDTTPPAAPGGVNGVPGDRSATVSWQANTEADLAGYRVYRRTSGDAWPTDALTPVSATSYTDTGLQNDTSYDYRVTAVDTSGNESVPSSAVTVRPAASASPCSASGSYSAAVLATADLSAYWRLGETTGSVACDARGTSPGAYAGGVTLGSPGAIAGDPNSAAAFNGSTGNVKIGSTSALNPTAAMSFEAWVAPSTVGPRQTLIRKEKQYLLRIYNGTLVGRMWWTDGTFTEVTSSAVIGTVYQHVAMTYDGSAIRLFRNGTQVGSTNVSKTLATGSNALYLGMSPDPSQNYDLLAGGLDEVALYSTALSPSVVADHYSLGTTVDGAGPSELTAIGAPGTVGLTWTSVAGATGYRVYQRAADDTWPTAPTASTTATSYVVSGLVDGQGYDYRVTAIVGGVESSPSVTAQASPTNNVLLAAGDLADSTFRAQQTARLLDRASGQVLMLGDAVYPDGSATDYQNYYSPTWGRHLWRTQAAIGNKEYTTDNGAPYWNYFGAMAGPRDLGYYSYDLGDWHVVVLNSNCSKVACFAGSPQEQWLRADLASSTARCTVAMWHHPRFSSTSPGAPDGTTTDFWRALTDFGVELVLNGHDHAYERFAPQTADGQVSQSGVRQFTVGTGGRSLVTAAGRDPNSQTRISDTLGILRLDLGSNNYSWEFVPVDGQTSTDSGTDTCH